MNALYAWAAGGHVYVLGVLVGFMAITLWALIPAQHRLDGRGYALLEARMNTVLQRLIVIGLLTGAVATVLAFQQDRSTAWLHLAATLGLLAMAVSTLIINHPVNNAINEWDPDDLPEDWARSRARWELGHRIRVTLGLPALACAVVAIVLPRA